MDKINIKTALALNFLIIMNYFFWLFNFELLRNLIILFLFLIFINYLTKNSIRENYPEKLFIIITFLICLGSSDNDWDGRYIWFFHAKRIFYENNIYAQLDNYLPYTHNDYPVLVPSLTASLKNFFPFSTYTFPKLSSAIMIITPIIFVSAFIESNIKKIFFFSIFLWVHEKTFLSGSVDDILSIYTLASSMVIYFFLFTNREIKAATNMVFVCSILFMVSLTLIKNEGSVILMVMIITGILIKKITLNKKINIKIILTFFISFIPIILWKVMCIKNGIYSDLISVNSFYNLKERLFDLRSYWNIFNFTILNKSIILPILLFIVMISKKIRIKQMSGSLKLFFININKINFLYYSVSCFLYYCIIFLIYLSTPNDLTWHLSTSAYRVMMPIGLMLTFYSFFDLKKNYKFFSL